MSKSPIEKLILQLEKLKSDHQSSITNLKHNNLFTTASILDHLITDLIEISEEIKLLKEKRK